MPIDVCRFCSSKIAFLIQFSYELIIRYPYVLQNSTTILRKGVNVLLAYFHHLRVLLIVAKLRQYSFDYREKRSSAYGI